MATLYETQVPEREVYTVSATVRNPGGETVKLSALSTVYEPVGSAWKSAHREAVLAIASESITLHSHGMRVEWRCDPAHP